VRSAGHAKRVGERRGAYRALVGKPERRRPPEDPGVDEKTILKWISHEGLCSMELVSSLVHDYRRFGQTCCLHHHGIYSDTEL
jgi:hypothetical protein